MYLGQVIQGQAEVRKANTGFGGPQFPEPVIARADKIELWHSSFNDPGDDFDEFRAFEGPKELARKRLNGY